MAAETPRFKMMQLSTLVETRRERDAQALEQMAVYADGEYRWPRHPDEKKENLILYAAYKYLATTAKAEITTPILQNAR